MVTKVANSNVQPEVYHKDLHTTFAGLIHTLSTPEAPVHQYRGIKYASIPARFRQSKLLSSYPPIVNATHYGPICPQPNGAQGFELDMFGLNEDAVPRQTFKQDEFECLNLNITCPAGGEYSRLPVMLWIHGGGNRGSGSSWLFDGGAFVQNSVQLGKPVILVTINYRLGILGFASSPALRDDNRLAGDEGVGNYGLRDQEKAMEWVHSYISAFGGDPNNVTLFGESTGAADILCHLHSSANEASPIFHRTIIQSASLELDVPNIHSAGWQLNRTTSALRVHTIDDFRKADVDRLVALGFNIRATDDGSFFRVGWRDSLYPEGEATTPTPTTHARSTSRSRCVNITVEGHMDVPELQALAHHRHVQIRSTSRSVSRQRYTTLDYFPPPTTPSNMQPMMIGDCGAESLQWTLPASLWTGPGVVRRLRAVTQSLSKCTTLLKAYDITSCTPSDELPERLLELINDARFAWPTERIAKTAKMDRGGRGVWRYVFDQESPSKGVPHHGVDLMYLFDTVPLPALVSASEMVPETFSSSSSPSGSGMYTPPTPEMYVGGSDSSSEDGRMSPVDYGFGTEVDDEWGLPVVDEWTYNRVRDAIQGRWLTFAYGQAPWKEDKVYVFGPEGECGERNMSIFGGRRRVGAWKEALEPLGMHLVQKIGVELSNGPGTGSKAKW